LTASVQLTLSQLAVFPLMRQWLADLTRALRRNRLGKAPFVVDATRSTNHMNRIAGPVGQHGVSDRNRPYQAPAGTLIPPSAMTTAPKI
jgi:hypothetical protein